jgi:hypothetical protein
VPEVTEKPGAQTGASSTTANLADEYPYVVSDLKRIAMIAAVMLVVLIILAVVVV